MKKFILLTISFIFLIIFCLTVKTEDYTNKLDNVDLNIENDPIPSRNTANNTGRKEGELRKNGL